MASHSCPSALATLSNLFKLVSLLGRNAESNSAVRNWNVQKIGLNGYTLLLAGHWRLALTDAVLGTGHDCGCHFSSIL